jgi:hypothetical protein
MLPYCGRRPTLPSTTARARRSRGRSVRRSRVSAREFPGAPPLWGVPRLADLGLSGLELQRAVLEVDVLPLAVRISERTRHPVMYATSNARSQYPGNWASTASNGSRSKNTLHVLSSRSLTIVGRFGISASRGAARFNAASSRLIVALGPLRMNDRPGERKSGRSARVLHTPSPCRASSGTKSLGGRRDYEGRP